MKNIVAGVACIVLAGAAFLYAVGAARRLEDEVEGLKKENRALVAQANRVKAACMGAQIRARKLANELKKKADLDSVSDRAFEMGMWMPACRDDGSELMQRIGEALVPQLADQDAPPGTNIEGLARALDEFAQ
jgi:hypothetical protein